MPKKKDDFTVVEFLQHMGRGVVETNIQAMKMLQETMSSNDLDGAVPLGKHKIQMDGVTITPEGWFRLDELEIECESSVHIARDENGEAAGLAISMSKGLFKKGMNVTFRAKYSRSGMIEAVEILRTRGNEVLKQTIAGLEVKCHTTEKEE